jgi:hypothetical protein
VRPTTATNSKIQCKHTLHQIADDGMMPDERQKSTSGRSSPAAHQADRGMESSKIPENIDYHKAW